MFKLKYLNITLIRPLPYLIRSRDFLIINRNFWIPSVCQSRNRHIFIIQNCNHFRGKKINVLIIFSNLIGYCTLVLQKLNTNYTIYYYMYTSYNILKISNSNLREFSEITAVQNRVL